MKCIFEVNTICRLCLRVNEKVYRINNTHHKAFIESIIKLKQFHHVPTDDEYVCYFCYALLKKTFNFMQTVWNAQEIICVVLKNSDKITKQIVECIDRHNNGLNSINLSSVVVCENVKNDSSDDNNAGTEIEESDLDHKVDKIGQSRKKKKNENNFSKNKFENHSRNEKELSISSSSDEDNEPDKCNLDEVEVEIDNIKVEIDDPLTKDLNTVTHDDLKPQPIKKKIDKAKRNALYKATSVEKGGKCKKKDDDYQPDSTSHSEDSERDSYDDAGKPIKRPKNDRVYPRKCDHANINIEARATIIKLHKSGLNRTQISDETGLNRNTVSLWIKRYEEEGSLASRQRSGRPSLISEAQRRHMVGEYETNGFTPTGYFAELFDTSLQTVRRALHAEGLHNRKPAKKPFLTETHKQERLRFARDYLDFDWNTTIFSDEKTFKSSQKGRLHLWRKDNTRWCDKTVIPNTDSGRITINMWGWMSAAGPGELAFIPPRANSSTYVDALDDVMLPTVRIVYPADELTQFAFVQDNCPIHRASTVREWFHNHPEIFLVPWPARSPDLNPMENLWGLMVQRWESRDKRCIQELKTHCMEVWENLRGTEVCGNIVGSLRKRLLGCIENNGGYTKY